MNTKQEQARTLFLRTDLPKTDIADMLGIPRRTLHHWITTNNWERQKQAAAHMPALLAENCYHIILRLQQHLMSDDRVNTPITRQEADTLHKLILTIGKMNSRATLNESMEMMEGFMENVNTVAPAMSQHIMPFVENYLANRSSITPQQLRSGQIAADNNFAKQETDDDFNEDSNKAAHQYKPTTINENAQQTYKARRESRPDYKDILAEFRQQDETIKHLFPIYTRQPLAA